MTTLRMEAAEGLDAEMGAVAVVGFAGGGERFGWLGVLTSPPAPGAAVDLPPAELLPVEVGMATAEVLRVLRFWPAWRLVGRAGPELGTRLLVLGHGPLAEAVRVLAERRGAVVTCTTDSSRAGPSTWDSVILTDSREELLSASLRACRTLGALVVGAGFASEIDLDLYADVHRRGLDVSGIDPYAISARARSIWPEDARRVSLLRPWDAPGL